METLDLTQMSAMVDIIAEEKGLPEDVVLDVVEQAIAAAWRKDNGTREMNVRASLNTKTGAADVYIIREVVADDTEEINPATQIKLSEAGKDAEVGGTVEEKIKVTTIGRVAAQTAKQVVIQRLREAEANAVLAAFEDKIGTVVTGTVTRVEPRLVRVDLDKATGIMPRSEQIEGEYYTVSSRIKVFIKKIEKGDKGSQLVVSRGCPEFIEYLFRQEVPEIDNGTVEIRGIAREAGRRTKIAVSATVNGIDPVGTFVGGRGIRVQAVMNEIGEREKIDIITWSDNVPEYIREALSPAEIVKVEINGKKAKVYVTEDQQSIAIGRQGQNVRLASKLTGYDLDIELAKAAPKKKKKNVEDALLTALGEVEEDAAAEGTAEVVEAEAEKVVEGADAEATDVAEKSEEKSKKAEEKLEKSEEKSEKPAEDKKE